MIVVSVATPPEPLTESVTVNITVAEKKRVVAAAKASGLSQSAWGRQAFLARLTPA